MVSRWGAAWDASSMARQCFQVLTSADPTWPICKSLAKGFWCVTSRVAWLLEEELRSVDNKGGQWEQQEGQRQGEGVWVVKRHSRCVAGLGGSGGIVWSKGVCSEATAYAGVTVSPLRCQQDEAMAMWCWWWVHACEFKEGGWGK